MLAPPMAGVHTAMMIQQWRRMTFLHWRYPVEEVRPLLPDGLTPDTDDDRVWVGMLPFLMDEVCPPRLPPVPWLSTFPETNLRTYVRGPDGGSGIYFLSLDAARLPAPHGSPLVHSSPGVRTRIGLPHIIR